MSDHEALLLNGRDGRMRVASTPSIAPDDCQIAVQAHAVAVNPMDRFMPALARFITPWRRYPAVLGSDVAMGVVAVQAAVARCRAGQRALGLALGAKKGRGAVEGAFHLLPRAPREWRYVAAPFVAGHGLDEISAASAAVAKGLSSRKIVVTP